ncbi:MAG TPA: chromate resistance protein ChrB domain-containing protein [Burkholderiales bacterium]|nr:chromate resistance protein ChrB domain-containing protein [Burkholderiales bacterium]
MNTSISYTDVRAALQGSEPPLLIDVRRRPAFDSAADMASGALRRDPEAVSAWAPTLPGASRIVVYCVHGHEVSQNAAKALRERGLDACYLEGGLEEGWKAGGGALDRKPAGASTRWVTRERPKIDRIACPWLISRFVDPRAEFLYVPSAQVRETAAAREAVPYDIPDTHFSHDGARCSFDAFLKHYRLADPALQQLATIVRGADTGELDLAPQAPGLLAISLGLSRNFENDLEMLEHGKVMYDALYAWCRQGQSETHTWNPAAYV